MIGAVTLRKQRHCVRGWQDKEESYYNSSHEFFGNKYFFFLLKVAPTRIATARFGVARTPPQSPQGQKISRHSPRCPILSRKVAVCRDFAPQMSGFALSLKGYLLGFVRNLGR